MTPQEKIANRLYELLPHKKELEFGCKVLMKHNVIGDHDVICALYHGENFSFNLSLRGNKDYYPKDVVEIIGQPLRLADILLAIGKSNYGIDSNGNFGLLSDLDSGILENRCVKYNLSKDNILDQSDELCDFCLGLLKD
jgi:hypothetical protein